MAPVKSSETPDWICTKPNINHHFRGTMVALGFTTELGSLRLGLTGSCIGVSTHPLLSVCGNPLLRPKTFVS